MARAGISGYSTDSKSIVSVFKMGKFKRGEALHSRLVSSSDGFGWVPPVTGSMFLLFSAIETFFMRSDQFTWHMAIH